jgi:seryl-tRNA synthetase
MEIKDLLEKGKREEMTKQLGRKGYKGDLDKIIKLETERLDVTPQLDKLRAEANKLAKAKDIEGGKKISGEVKTLEVKYQKIINELQPLLNELPNPPADDVPDGGENDGKVLKAMGVLPNLKNPKDHIELGASLDLIDIERGVKASGSRFCYLKNQAVELEFALIQMVGGLLANRGFKFLMGPQLLSEKAMMAGGYLGKASEEVYKTQDDLYLAGTSEQTILAYHMDEIIEVPKRYASFSTCYRREAGSYGKDVKGIIRTHQFDKIEMFMFVEPTRSEEELEFLSSIQEEILQGLEIPYKKVLLAAGDLSIASAKTIDMESYLPSQNTFRETHSASNCTDWQARRANIRYKVGKQTEYVHTLNGTGIAIGRLLAVMLENYQQEDGSIKIPTALHPYLSFKEIK